MYRSTYGLAGIAIVVLVLSYVTHFTSNPMQYAYACSCGERQTPEEAFRDMTAVFSGRVIEVHEVREFDSETLPIPFNIVYFDVEESWKGIKNDPTKVSTTISGDMCGYEFEMDKEYLVYAHGQQIIGAEDDWGTGLCFRTTSLSNAESDLTFLGAGQPWSEVKSSADILVKERIIATDYPVAEIVIGSVIVITVGGIIGFVAIWRRKRKNNAVK